MTGLYSSGQVSIAGGLEGDVTDTSSYLRYRTPGLSRKLLGRFGAESF